MSDDTFTAADFAPASGGDTSTPAPAEPAAPVETTAQPGAATTAPAVATTANPTTTEPTKTGPIPFDVHTRALENARAKAVEEWKGKYGWAEQIDQQSLQEAIRIAQLSKADPIAYVQEYIKELQGHDTYGPQLRSLAARALASARGQQQEQEPQPDLPIQLEDGRVVHLYSAEQQAKREAYLQKQWMASVKQELQPMVKTVEQVKAERDAAAAEAETQRYLETTWNDLLTWPGMDDKGMRAEVGKYLEAHPSRTEDPRDIAIALSAAYRAVVVPKRDAASRQAVVDDIHKQANASTVNPALSGTKTQKTVDEMSIAEALQYYAAQQAAG